MTLRDVVYLAAYGLFGVFFGLLLSHWIFSTIFDSLLTTSMITGSPLATNVLNTGQSIINRFDQLAIASFFSILFGFIVTSWFTRSFPILIPFYFIGGIAAVIIAMFSANFWEDLTNSTTLVTSLAYFPFANHVMLNLPVYITVFFVVGIVIIFAKPGGGEDSAYG